MRKLNYLKLSLVPKGWFCPLCHKNVKQQQSKCQEALKLDSICLCKKKPLQSDKLLKCHSESCASGKFFHLSCLNYKRKPNNAKTTWLCPTCALNNVKTKQTKTNKNATSNFNLDSFTHKSPKVSESKCNIIKDPTGWLTGDIIQDIHEALAQIDNTMQGLQDPVLGQD